MNELETVERSTTGQLPVTSAPKALTVARSANLELLARRPAALVAFHVNRLGSGGVVGLGLSLFAAVMLVTAIMPQYRQAASLEAQIVQLKRRPAPKASAHERVSDFILKLPTRDELPKVAGRIFALASGAGVSLDKGRYELAPLKSGHLARYRMSFPIKGSYTDVRHFIDATLTALPSVSVEGLRIERKNAGDASVEADVRLNVFVRNDP